MPLKHAASQTPCVQCQSPPIQLVSEDSLKDYKEFKGGKWDRKTYKIVIAYDGSAFAGWQRQPALHTVQGYNIVGFHEVLLCYGVGKWNIFMIFTTNLCYRVLEQALGKFCDGKKAASLKCEGFSVEAVVTVAGRTDKGVHAAGQVCSFCKLTVSFFYNLFELGMPFYMATMHAIMCWKWNLHAFNEEIIIMLAMLMYKLVISS